MLKRGPKFLIQRASGTLPDNVDQALARLFGQATQVGCR
jgi:hypothetical protein